MGQIDEFPDRPPLYGFFGQGKFTPHTTHLFKEWARLTSDAAGELLGTPLHGYFFVETLLVSHCRHRLNGGGLEGRFSVQTAPNEWVGAGAISHTVCNGELPAGTRPTGSLELQIRRVVERAWIERVCIRNHGATVQEFDFELEIGVPIGDMEYEEEMKFQDGPRTEGLSPEVRREANSIELRYERDFGRRHHTPTENVREIAGSRAPHDGDPVVRGLVIEVIRSGGDGATLDCDAGRLTRIRFRGELPARGRRDLEIRMVPVIDGRRIEPPEGAGAEREVFRETLPAARFGTTRFGTSHSALDLILAQARVDLGSLRLEPFVVAPPSEREGMEIAADYAAFNAGIPRYTGVFGRDILITAHQAALLGTDHFEPALRRVAAYRGRALDPWRDEEPDRLPHELRLNPDGAIGKTNRYLYYGDVTSTPFWVTTLYTAWSWRGERALLERERSNLEACLRWIERRLENGDGYIRYAPMRPDVPGSNANQAWKDSGDAIVDEHGRIVAPPLAVCEVQGYAYRALREGALLIGVLDGETRQVERLRSAAERLRARFDRDFWLSDLGFYALGLDGAGRPLRSVASNAGHCLGTGILLRERVEPTVEMLLGSRLFSGWGIRTLAEDHPAYDPYSYHRGSVWPVENATIASGLADLGYRAEANRIVAAQLSLATCFESMRLPETVSGHARSADYPLPGVYPFAEPLQAWSVSAIFSFVKTMIGARPDAGAETLYLDPELPPWLPDFEVRELRVGGASVDLRFARGADGRTSFEILDKRGALRVVPGKPERQES